MMKARFQLVLIMLLTANSFAQDIDKVRFQLDSLNGIKEGLKNQINDISRAIEAKSKELLYLDLVSRQEESYKRLTAKSDIIVRDQKSYLTGSDIFTIKKNENFVVTEFEGYFYGVEYDGKHGFAHISFLEDIEYDLGSLKQYWIERNKSKLDGKKEESKQLYIDVNPKSHGSAVQCSEGTQDGSRCRRTTTNSNGKCFQHGGN